MDAALGDTKRRIIERMKRSDAITAAELARELGVTDEAVRQHLDALVEHGLVAEAAARRGGRGRPSKRWSLTPLAADLFPDRHGDLTVALIDAIRTAAGEEGLDRVIEARTQQQHAAYTRAVPASGRASLRERVAALADQRTAEGYMAEVAGDGDDLLLVEHHCPVCDAASACQGLCRSELDLFRRVLGDGVTVERTSHLLSGDRRCVYRIRERS